MEKREEDLGATISEEGVENQSGGQIRKQFSECDCETPIIEPISYMLPDQRFISLLHCTACGGLERYSISDLSNTENKPQEKRDKIEYLLEERDILERENERLQKKINRQSRRLRESQNARSPFSTRPAVIDPNNEGNNEADTQPEDHETENQNGTQIPSPVRKFLLICLIVGVTITGSVVWTTEMLSSVAIIVGTLLIALPLLLLTDGALPRS